MTVYQVRLDFADFNRLDGAREVKASFECSIGKQMDVRRRMPNRWLISATTSVMMCRRRLLESGDSLHFLVLLLRRDQNRQVSVSIYPHCKELFIGFTTLRRIARNRQRTRQSEIRERVQGR